MFSLWIVLISLMADIMGHGGDGAGDPPPPGGWAHGHQEYDQPVRRRVRGKAKNLKMRDELRRRGRPLDLEFDTEATYTPVGKHSSYFTRELGIYMWRRIAFDREGWKNVDRSDRNALEQHIRQCFDLDKVARDIEADHIEGGIQFVIQKRYSDRKNMCKKKFDDAGGYDDVEGARTRVPPDMSAANWNKAIDHFLSESFRRRSEANKQNRQHQLFPNRGGTSSYSNTCCNENLERVQAYYRGNTDKYGRFIDPQAEMKYNELLAELESQGEQPGEEGSQPEDVVGVFEKVLGPRRGHIRGIGHKPSTATSSTFFDPFQSSCQDPADFSQEYIERLWNNPHFRAKMDKTTGSSSKCSNFGGEDDDGDDGDNDDDMM